MTFKMSSFSQRSLINRHLISQGCVYHSDAFQVFWYLHRLQ